VVVSGPVFIKEEGVVGRRRSGDSAIHLVQLSFLFRTCGRVCYFFLGH
jgi:hypothetical protein